MHVWVSMRSLRAGSGSGGTTEESVSVDPSTVPPLEIDEEASGHILLPPNYADKYPAG